MDSERDANEHGPAAQSCHGMTAVILAGGKGTRLSPFTHCIPKPMLPIGKDPVVKHLILGLKRHGIGRVIMAVGYMGEYIRAYLRDGSELGVDIEYSDEREPLGTAGPLWLLRDRLPGTFVAVNGDTVTDLDWSDMIDYHRNNRAAITVGAASKVSRIDLGVIKVGSVNDLIGWQEKPASEYLAAMGAYVIERRVLEVMTGSPCDLPDLVMRCRNEGEKIRVYQHHGQWLDIGRPSDYETACHHEETRGK